MHAQRRAREQRRRPRPQPQGHRVGGDQRRLLRSDDGHRVGDDVEQQIVLRLRLAAAPIAALELALGLDKTLLQRRLAAQVAAHRQHLAMAAQAHRGIGHRHVVDDQPGGRRMASSSATFVHLLPARRDHPRAAGAGDEQLGGDLEVLDQARPDGAATGLAAPDAIEQKHAVAAPCRIVRRWATCRES